MSAKYIIKFITIGRNNVGKSCIIIQYTEDKFCENINSTIGVDYKKKFIQKGNELIKLSIFDTAGQERYSYLTKNFYKGTNGALLVYDITCRDSFNKLNFWLNDLKNNSDDIDNLFIYLVGNKKDLEEKREVSYDEASEFAYENNIPYIEVSAKTGENIDKLFDEMVKGTIKNIMKKRKEQKNYIHESMRISFLDKKTIKLNNKKCC